ncbi:hypothetical protein OIU77_022305 [Salix suchowensis]|uniref:Uncharacterized protein n=1 Tax=Salix suchowensis TaxID=1278906 RepID=A0ABQ9BZU0_9ROSI|nr:hypothetical protein OIU78_009197 [Salix suchowensis]KAJ6392792.1 hypothetical protein OIU77_022305 [Salix suchowensis]
MTGVSTEDLIAAIAKKETRLRNCYAETFEKLASEEFVKMMMMDGSFIHEITPTTFDAPHSSPLSMFSF